MKGLRHIILGLLLLSIFDGGHLKTPDQYEQTLADLEAYIQTKKQEVNPRYKLQYHVTPPVGWVNDPNGFVYYKEEYHLFYQFYPYDTVWGPIHWGHVSSPDLVHWKQLQTALLPEKEQCFSGSAIVDGDTLVLIYTGHVITDKEPFYNQSQYLAYSDDGIHFHKYAGNPVLRGPKGIADFRDPKIWKHGNCWYVVIGSKTYGGLGTVLLYKSDDMKEWKFLSVIAESHGDMGYMFECPDFFELNGKHILLMSPQGIKPRGDRFKNLYQTGYIVGEFNYTTFKFIPETEFQEIDFGHDFYASQTTDVDRKRYLIGWLGMWEEPRLEASDGWVNAMTIARELTLSSDNRILSKPVDTIHKLRQKLIKEGNLKPDEEIDFNSTGELIIDGDIDKKIELLIDGSEGADKVWLRWDPKVGKVVLDRNGDVRQVEWKSLGSTQWRIFLDNSSLEWFCGEGEVVFSSRVYPKNGWRVINKSPHILNIQAYILRSSVKF